jgi:hypothetical protein
VRVLVVGAKIYRVLTMGRYWAKGFLYALVPPLPIICSFTFHDKNIKWEISEMNNL